MMWLLLVVGVIWLAPSALVMALYASSLTSKRARGWLQRHLVA